MTIPMTMFPTNDTMKTGETISDSAECSAGLSVHFESSAACV